MLISHTSFLPRHTRPPPIQPVEGGLSIPKSGRTTAREFQSGAKRRAAFEDP